MAILSKNSLITVSGTTGISQLELIDVERIYLKEGCGEGQCIYMYTISSAHRKLHFSWIVFWKNKEKGMSLAEEVAKRTGLKKITSNDNGIYIWSIEKENSQ